MTVDDRNPFSVDENSTTVEEIVQELDSAYLSDMEKLDYVFHKMQELEPVLDAIVENLPELMAQVGPIVEGLKKSPVLKMLGVSL